jgi:replication factor A1
MTIKEDESKELMKIGELNSYSRQVNTIAKVVSKTETREVTSRIDQTSHRVAEALVGDETGAIYLTLWDDAIDNIEEGQTLSIKNAYVNLFRGSMRLNLGRYGSYEVVEESPISEVNLDNNLSSQQFEQQPGRRFDRGGGGFSGRRPTRGRRY